MNEGRKFLVILLIIVLAGWMGYLILEKNSDRTVEVRETPPQVFISQEECERTVAGSCRFQNCDYVPAGKTFEEVCGKDFKKGWVASF